MLWHFHGLQGGGKSWGMCVIADDMQRIKGYKVFANFWIEIGEPISIKRLLNYEYNKCVLLLDEAYGVGDSHTNNPVNTYLSEVIHQSRKRECEVFFGTQLLGDLYKRIRESAHRRIECINTGTEKEPELNYFIRNNYDQMIKHPFEHNPKIGNPLYFDTETVRSAYHLFNSDEKIMPMHMNPELTFEKVLEIKEDSPNAKTFITLMKAENPFMDKETYGACYALLKEGKDKRVKGLLKLK
jgi:hypothetical protein